MNTAKKSYGGGPLDPPSNTPLLDPIIHINTKKVNIKTFQQLNTLYYMQVVCKMLCKTWTARSCPLLLTLAQPPFFLLFKKFVAVENKYSVLDLPGNKFSGRARDEINNLSRPKVPAPPLQNQMVVP